MLELGAGNGNGERCDFWTEGSKACSLLSSGWIKDHRQDARTIRVSRLSGVYHEKGGVLLVT